MRALLNYLRSRTPLSIRKRVGPLLAYAVYIFRVYVRGKTWEPSVLTTDETVRKIADEKLSAIRFGDGEISLIEGHHLGFQDHDAELARRLEEVVKAEVPGLLICVPRIFGNINTFTKRGFWFELHHLFRYSVVWRRLTRRNRVYGDAFFTRPYLTFNNTSGATETFKEIRNLWNNQDVLLLEGEKSRNGVGNDLFSTAHTMRRILCPSENAFVKVDEILEQVRTFDRDNLILLSLGPAAKVIGYTLFKEGYRVLDIGHIDMEYEMFLRKSDEIIKVPYKYFNELNARDPESCMDPTYQAEIVATII